MYIENVKFLENCCRDSENVQSFRKALTYEVSQLTYIHNVHIHTVYQILCYRVLWNNCCRTCNVNDEELMKAIEKYISNILLGNVYVIIKKYIEIFYSKFDCLVKYYIYIRNS